MRVGFGYPEFMVVRDLRPADVPKQAKENGDHHSLLRSAPGAVMSSSKLHGVQGAQSSKNRIEVYDFSPSVSGRCSAQAKETRFLPFLPRR
jgi:hypothetical protein